MTHVLVTGGAGYIGSHAVLAAREVGLCPVVVDNLSTGFRAAVPPEVPFFEGSILDAQFLDHVMSRHRIESILHFAAHLNIEESMREPLKYYENNFGGTLSLLRASARAGTVRRFVFSSTCAVYGNPGEMPVGESCPVAPLSPYGGSKLASEFLIRDYCANKENQMNAVILRYFNVAGADPKRRVGQSTPHATQLVKTCAEVALGKRPHLTVFGSNYNTPDGTCVRDYIHVSDLAEAHVLALNHLQAYKGVDTFNLGYGRGHSVLEVAKAMQEVSGVGFEVAMTERRAGDAAAVYADPRKAQAELGFRPKHQDLKEICRTALVWEQLRHY